jgi:hypothetical protein
MYGGMIMDLGKELLKTMQIMIDRKFRNYKSDRTYKSVVKRLDKRGYVILDETGSERIVQCCIPGVHLQAGQLVYIKEPLGRLNDIHICGIIENKGNPGRKR